MGTIVGIFAHPDDESFGPGGTLAKLAKTNDVYIICVTGGGAGQNARTKTTRKLSEIRKEEYRNAAKILGVKKSHCLEYEDGTLSNSLYHEIAHKIESIVKKLKPEILLTFEPKGVSGHIDHITVSMITTYVFRNNPQIKKLMYYCILNTRREKYLDDYFIYFPEGYKTDEIDLEVDTAKTFKTKIQAISAHKSQKEDADRIIKSLLTMPPREYFLVRHQ
ncbi:MAG: PIG-L deacetylase family protein [Candidatus Levybacteria bacterium]|nr:PIG-L deacetylase family protein [Candidatus Levybacteria bacterium]